MKQNRLPPSSLSSTQMRPSWRSTMGDRVTEAATTTIEHPLTPTLAKTANVLAKGALLLLLPTGFAYAGMEPGTSYSTFVLVAALTGVGGGNFASSMTNINAFFPLRKKGWALGLNAGGGNIGVPVIQLAALAIIALIFAARQMGDGGLP